MCTFEEFHHPKFCHIYKSCLSAAPSGFDATRRNRVSPRRGLCVFLRWRWRVLLQILSAEHCDYRYDRVLKKVPVLWTINCLNEKNSMLNNQFHWVSKNMNRNELCFLDCVLTFFLLCLKYTFFFKISPIFANKSCLTW